MVLCVCVVNAGGVRTGIRACFVRRPEAPTSRLEREATSLTSPSSSVLGHFYALGCAA